MNAAINHTGLRPRKNVPPFQGKSVTPWKLALYSPLVNVADSLLLDSFEIFIVHVLVDKLFHRSVLEGGTSISLYINLSSF